MIRKKSERKKRGKESEGMEVNMTPMIDVTFQLIIFFLCLKFKTLEGKLGAYLPKDRGVNREFAPPKLKLDLHVYRAEKGERIKLGARDVWQGGRLKWKVNNMPFSEESSLLRNLRRIARENPDPERPGMPIPVAIHAHKDVFYGDITRMVDQVLNCGFVDVTFAGGYTK